MTDLPPRCRVADILRGQWYSGNSAAYKALVEHQAKCPLCKEREAALNEIAENAPIERRSHEDRPVH